MAWPKGKPTPPYPNAGRKGFVTEERQRKRMESLLNRFLTLSEKIESGKATPNQIVAYERLERTFHKIMDKMHANKTDVKLDVEKPIIIL